MHLVSSAHLQRDFPQYAWSLPTLSRRLAHFNIKYIDYGVDIEEVKAAVGLEIDGPGRLLGYRGMQRKIREHHELAVPRGLVYDVMTNVDPEGLECRRNVGAPKKRKRGPTGTFTSLVSGKLISNNVSVNSCRFSRPYIPGSRAFVVTE